jgi:hypothetical protein
MIMELYISRFRIKTFRNDGAGQKNYDTARLPTRDRKVLKEALVH